MLSNKQLQVDAQNIDHGYFVARSSKKAKKLKLQVLHYDSLAYLYYDLNGKKEYETFPLQLGNGEYIVTLYKQVIGTKYANAGSVKFTTYAKKNRKYPVRRIEKNTFIDGFKPWISFCIG